ncbi:MAG: hypothetical protein V3T83_07645 [Acidobacteriota bacterium]
MSKGVQRALILAATVILVTVIIYFVQSGAGPGEVAECAITCPDGTSCNAACPAPLVCGKTCDPSARCRCIEAEDAAG